jgi:hypothetical protein
MPPPLPAPRPSPEARATSRTRAPASSTPPARAIAPTAVHADRASAERRVVALLLAGLGVMVVLLASLSVRATVQRGDARSRAGGALARAGLAQREYHARQGRFAFWEELAADGLRLPAAMSVDASNATPSHWYLRLRDSTTGLLCDRVGVLTDPPGEVVPPSCRAP